VMQPADARQLGTIRSLANLGWPGLCLVKFRAEGAGRREPTCGKYGETEWRGMAGRAPARL
jgi:hypothetical protein